jgi:protoporphyrinogen/coproporphyrinogen III oxidase
VKQVAIIGGGISGLSAAFYLEKARRSGIPLQYTLFEKSSTLGGALFTEEIDGCLVEAGADSFLTEKPWAAELCRELCLADQLIGSNDEQRQTFIVRKQKLIPLPRGMVFFVPTDLAAIKNSALFSANGKRRIESETMLTAASASGEDESVADFVERHFGSEMLERVADPLLAGVYGGNARKLSMQAVMPRFLQMEREWGSLVRALTMRAASTTDQHSPLFTTLKGGMQQLVQGILAQLERAAIRTDTEVRALELHGNKWRLVSKTGTQEFDTVILTAPAYAAARLLTSSSPTLAALLRRIKYSSSVTVALGYAAESSDGKKLRSLKGFGFLVPYTERQRSLACTFVHNKFPERVPSDRALLRLFFGGVRDAAVQQLSDSEFAQLARRELRALLKVQAEPLFLRVHRWRRAMPQYNLGHEKLVERIHAESGQLPRLYLAGSAFHGVGVSDCVRQGRDAAGEVISRLKDAARAT